MSPNAENSDAPQATDVEEGLAPPTSKSHRPPPRSKSPSAPA